jgi:branched-chain amino acid transport system substrate-binding protein
VLGALPTWGLYSKSPLGPKPASRDYPQAKGIGHSGSFWDAALPYHGNQEFVAAYTKEFSHAPAVQSAGSYAGCQLLLDAIRRTGGVESEKLREALLTIKTRTLFGDFAVHERGYQTAHKAVTIQWQDGKQVIVWPDEVAIGKARLPTPVWSMR